MRGWAVADFVGRAFFRRHHCRGNNMERDRHDGRFETRPGLRQPGCALSTGSRQQGRVISAEPAPRLRPSKNILMLTSPGCFQVGCGSACLIWSPSGIFNTTPGSPLSQKPAGFATERPSWPIATSRSFVMCSDSTSKPTTWLSPTASQSPLGLASSKDNQYWELDTSKPLAKTHPSRVDRSPSMP